MSDENDTKPEAALAPEAPPAKPLPTVREHAAKLPKGERWQGAAAEALHRWVGTERVSAEDYAAALEFTLNEPAKEPRT